MTNNMNGLVETVKRSVKDAVFKRVNEMARSLQSNLLYEFQNDLVFAGHSKEFEPLSSITVSVEENGDNQYKLVMDMSNLNDKQKELFEFYFKNAKSRVLGGDA